jgi:predicted DNA-binding transcriptional regulator AlpA
MNEKLLSVLELASLIQWNTSTVYRKALAGKIPGCVKLDGSVRFRESKIKEWIDDAGTREQGGRKKGERLL